MTQSKDGIDPFSGEAIDPFEVVSQWFAAAVEGGEPMPRAMTLATTTTDGQPAARVVFLRGLESGLVFFTDRESDKGAQLAANPVAAVVLHWLLPKHRQVRILGDVEEVGVEEVEAYWRSRTPRGRATAAASHQSRVVRDRALLEERATEIESGVPQGADLPRPTRWTGYRVVPTTIEFWQEGPDALHDRVRFQRSKDPTMKPANDSTTSPTTNRQFWIAERLAP